MSSERILFLTCLFVFLLAAAGSASATPVTDQIAAAVALPDGAGVVLDAVYVESVIGGSAFVRDTWAHSRSLLIFTDAAVQASWTVKVTGQMTTIDGQRVLIASAVQLYATIDGSPAPPVPACMLAAMPGVSLVDIPPMPAQRGIGVPMNTLETTSESMEQFDGSIASAKRVGGTVTLTGKAVTAVFHDGNGLVSFFYIQEPGTGVYGIKVIPAYAIPVEPGNEVELANCTVVPSSLTSTPPIAECYITAPSVKCTGNQALPRPLGVSQRLAASGHLGLQQALHSGTICDLTPGIGIVGTRIRVWGRVTYRDTANHVCCIDDGAGLQSTIGSVQRTGIRVIYESASPPDEDTMVAGVTGILGAEMDGGGNAVPVVRVPKDVPTCDEVICVRPYPDGNNTNGGEGWDDAVASVQAGIDKAVAANPKKEVWVAAGTYQEGITIDQSVALYGGFAGDETNRWERNWAQNPTVLDAPVHVPDDPWPAIIKIAFGTGATVRIDGFTIQNGGPPMGESAGFVDYGGGISGGGTPQSSEAGIVICNNTFYSNNGTYGGAIYCEYCTAVVWSNTFGLPGDTTYAHANSSQWGVLCLYFGHSGSLVACNDMHWDQRPTEVFSGNFNIVTSATKADIVYNNITDSGGGGILVVAGFEDLAESAGLVANNLIQRVTGSGVEVGECQLPVVIVDNAVVQGVKVSDNVIGQGSEGYGIWCWNTCAAVYHNTVHDISGGWAGMWFDGGSPTIEHNTLARCDGGGIVCSPGMELTAISPTIDGNTFDGNVNLQGGAMELFGVTSGVVENNLFIHNRATAVDYLGGGAIYAEDSEAAIVNNTFVENCVGILSENGQFPAEGEDIWADVTLTAFGGAVHVTRPTRANRHVTLINNIFYDNKAQYDTAVACTDRGTAAVSYCDAYHPESAEDYYFYDTSDPLCLLTVDVDTCCYADPSFASGGYWLSSSSLLYTTYHGTSDPPAPSVDIAGRQRPTGGYTEMGAYENQ